MGSPKQGLAFAIPFLRFSGHCNFEIYRDYYDEFDHLQINTISF